MVRCQICGKEVFSGWICGVVPADDKFKLGLCQEHDTPENRAMVDKAWEELMVEELGKAVQPAAEAKAKTRARGYEVTVNFLDGGVKILQTRAYNVSEEQDLLVLNENGIFEFYPLQHIRTFKVRDLVEYKEKSREE